MSIYIKVKNKFIEHIYISENGEDAVKNMYSRESHNKKGKYIKNGIWKDKFGIVRKVKLKPI